MQRVGPLALVWLVTLMLVLRAESARGAGASSAAHSRRGLIEIGIRIDQNFRGVNNSGFWCT